MKNFIKRIFKIKTVVKSANGVARMANGGLIVFTDYEIVELTVSQIEFIKNN